MPSAFKLSQSIKNRLNKRKRRKSRASNKKTSKKSDSRFISLSRISNIFFLFIFIGAILFGGLTTYAGFKFRTLEFENVNPERETKAWQADYNLNVLLLGVDQQAEDLLFIDSLQLMYVQPDSNSVNILSIDPDLHVSVNEDLEAIDFSAKRYFPLRRLYNYYLNEDKRQDTNLAMQEYIFAVEAELGLKIDRYLLVTAEDFTDLVRPIGPLSLQVEEQLEIPDEDITVPEGDRGLPARQHLAYVSAANTSTDNRLIRQSRYLAQFIDKTDHPLALTYYLYFIVSEEDLSGLIKTDFTAQELWRLHTLFRNASDSDIDWTITQERQKFIVDEKKFLDKRFFDESIRDLYYDQSTVEEQARIDVVNGSGKPGLASSTRRILRNHSFNVVSVANAEQEYENTTLYLPDPDNYADTIEQLRIFYPDLEVVREDYPFRPVGDMVLVVL
jgi:anionic cell wall polymer biosynthesis LytR-Cps2A-Psr (LCP) family protein